MCKTEYKHGFIHDLWLQYGSKCAAKFIRIATADDSRALHTDDRLHIIK